MKTKDFLWIGALIVFLSLMLVNPMAKGYVWINANFPYVAGFVKFAVLATMGDMLSLRIIKRGWTKIPGLFWRVLVYGFIGMLMTLVMQVFNNGVIVAMNKGFLPAGGMKFFEAFFTSVIMNCIFAPTFMMFHRISDTYIDMRCGEHVKPKLCDVLGRIDFVGFVSFVVVKTIPIFWIPAHTVTFMLPAQYRVLFAALLSLAMGAILSFAKQKPAKQAVTKAA